MVSIVISGLLSLPSCYLENEQNMSSGPFSHDAAHLFTSSP